MSVYQRRLDKHLYGWSYACMCGKTQECNYFFGKVKRGQGEQFQAGSVKVREVFVVIQSRASYFIPAV